LLQQAEGKPYHAQILYHLQQALATLHSEHMTADKVQTQLTKYKSQLRQQIGNPNCRQTWLKDLADAQAKERGTTPKKQLKQLIRTEEQWNHMCQIKQANHKLRGSGGLAKVTTMNK